MKRHKRMMAAVVVGGFVGAMLALLTGCNITLPKLPGGNVPPALTNVLPPIVVGPPQPAETNVYTIGKWHGPSGAEAKEVNCRIRAVKISKGKLYLDHDKLPWTSGMVVICCAVKNDEGEWEGGKFDWIVPITGQKIKLTENIEDDYNKIAKYLKEGAPMLVWFMAVRDMRASTATERSEYFLTEWHK